MKWVNFEVDGKLWCGPLKNQQVYQFAPRCLSHFLGDLSSKKIAATSGTAIPLDQVRLRQPVLRPGKILAIGLNYAAHVAESASFAEKPRPQVQVWFNKQATAASGPGDPIHVPRVSKMLDYEAELVVIIGKSGRHVPAERAMEIVAGFSCGCDASVRDWQKASPTMIMGKGFDTHAPFGPALVTPDEVGDLDALEIKGYVNGELRQSAKLGDMIHNVKEQIAHLSAAFTLEPGDVIFTGTPAGVGAGHTPPRWLKAGDRFRVEIENVGVLENPVINEPNTAEIGGQPL